jgi:hypothetical protein
MSSHQEMINRFKDQRAMDALGVARRVLETAIKELDHHGSLLLESESSDDKADIMNWTLSFLSTKIIPNLRLDLIAGAQAEFVRAAQAEGASS